jgi:hypothetical protein
MSTLSEFEAIFRRLPQDVQNLVSMLRAGTHNLSPKDLMRLLVAMIMAGGPTELIKRILVLMTRLGWLSAEVLTAALAEVEATVAAGAIAGAETAAAGAAAGGEATATAVAGGEAAATGGASAAAITAATVAAIAVLVVEVISVLSAVSSLVGKRRLADALDELNARVMEGIETLRAARTAGLLSEPEFQQEVDQISRAFIDGQHAIDARNNELQDALDDNFLIRIGEWFYGSTRNAPALHEPAEDPTKRVSMGRIRVGEVSERFAALAMAPDELLEQVKPAEIRYAANPFARREILHFFQEQWLEQSYADGYRRLCLRSARYFSTPADAPIIEFWQAIYADETANAFARKQAILACFRSEMSAAWDLSLAAARDDRDPIVRVLAYEILGSITRTVDARTEAFLGLAERAATSHDNASRLGAVCGLSLSMHLRRPQKMLARGVNTLKQLVANEKNCYIAGSALAALTPLVSECELGDYLPSVVRPEASRRPSQADLLVTTVNTMAALGDTAGFLQLTEHPEGVEIGEARAASLFQAAPFMRADDIVAIDDIGKRSFEAMLEGLHDNLLVAGVNIELPLTVAVLRDTLRRLRRLAEPTTEDLLIVALNVFAYQGDKDGFLLLSELPGRVDVGEARVMALFEQRPFRTIDDIKKVPGIAEKTIDAMARGVRLNLEKAGMDSRKFPTVATLQEAVETLRKC